MDNPQIPWLDRNLVRWFPGIAARREEARARFEYFNAFRGGITTRTSSPWTRSYSYQGGKASDRFNLWRQADRARVAYRENVIAHGLLSTEADNVVADGMRLQAKTSSKPFNAEAEDRWHEWMELADIRGLLCGSQLQRQFYMSPRRDGDGGIVLVDRGGQSRLQYIPRDLIQNPNGAIGAFGPTGNTMLDGIEVNSVTCPVAFHVLSLNEAGKRDYTRIPASNFVYLAPQLEEEDLGIRGTTCYGAIFDKLDQLDGYTDALVIAARMACIFGLIFKDGNIDKQFNSLSSLTNSAGNQQKAVTLENGMLKYVGKDSDVVQVQAQQPMQQAPDFIRMLCRMVGVPFDMPLELVLKDLSQVNFASARIGLLQYYRACRKRQRWFEKRCLSRIYRWWLDREIKMQNFTSAAPDGMGSNGRPAFEAHEFRPVGWDYTDPVNEAQADLLEITMGTKTPQMVSDEHGRDWEEMQIELQTAEAFRRLKALAPMVRSTLTRDAPEEISGNANPEPQKGSEQ